PGFLRHRRGQAHVAAVLPGTIRLQPSQLQRYCRPCPRTGARLTVQSALQAPERVQAAGEERPAGTATAAVAPVLPRVSATDELRVVAQVAFPGARPGARWRGGGFPLVSPSRARDRSLCRFR